ncbi:MAG: hypothetical protein KKD07_02040 [Candidatus Omnitrophica bacterium]|nr:hypothetical protein [Candidatus Omnitrophota bacterium]
MSVKVRKNIIPFILIMSLTIAFPSVIEAKKEPLKGRYGGTLVMGARDIPTIINPILTTHTVSLDLMNLIFDHLIRMSPKGEIEPGLAESWKISEDGLTYVFSLKKGIRFHDSVEFTADDVKFTYEQIMDPKNGSPYRSHFELIEKIEIIDKYTVKFVLSGPFPVFLTKLAYREIIPKHILEGQDLRNTSFNYSPIGTGPFKFSSWDRDTDQIELAANEDYFEGRPYLDKIIVKIYPEGYGLWPAFMREEVDFIMYINYEDYKVIEKDPDLRGYKIPWDKYCAIAYNLEDPVLCDKEVRKAIAQSINRKEIIDATFPGGVESTGPFHSESEGFNPEVKPLQCDPVKAKVDLMHRGWIDADNDGILEKDGRELEIRMLVDERSDLYKKMAVIIRQQLAEVGIKIVVQLYKDEEELTKEFLDEKRPQAWLRFYGGYEENIYGAIGSWYSLSSEFGRIWDYINEDVDRLFELGRVSVNKNKKAEIYREIHKIVYEDQPACFLFFPVSYHAVSSKFKNIDDYFSMYMQVYTIKNWYISSD